MYGTCMLPQMPICTLRSMCMFCLLAVVCRDAVGAIRNVQIVYTAAKPPSGVSWSVWRFWVFQMYFNMVRARWPPCVIDVWRIDW